MNLLIIDDNPKMRYLLRKMFEVKFENIYEREDGSEALDAFYMYLPAYVLMDVRMKIMDGINATIELKKSFPDAKIVIISVHNDILKNEAYNAGAIAFVKKDNLMELFEIIV